MYPGPLFYIMRCCCICEIVSLVTGEICLVNQTGTLSVLEIWTGIWNGKSRKCGRMKKRRSKLRWNLQTTLTFLQYHTSIHSKPNKQADESLTLVSVILISPLRWVVVAALSRLLRTAQIQRLNAGCGLQLNLHKSFLAIKIFLGVNGQKRHSSLVVPVRG